MTKCCCLLFALARAIEVIGEAATKVGVAARAELPDIRWAAIVGMRNRLVHAYFDIDRNVLWSTVLDELPGLKLRLEQALSVFALHGGAPGQSTEP